MTTGAHATTQRRHWGRWVAVSAAAVVLMGLAAFAWDAYQLRSAAAQIKSEASAAKSAVSARDADALQTQVAALQESAATFASATTGVHWWVANHLPWVGSQTRPLTEAGQAVLAVSEDALAPLASTGDLSALQAPSIVDGRIDPYVLEDYRPVLADAAAVFAQQQGRLAEVDVVGTVSAVREPFLELRTELASLGGLIQGAHVAAEVLPHMLGADAPRTYVVMIQNNAEPRTTGGIPGAVIEVTVDDGHIAMGRYATANQMIATDKINAPLTDDERRIFTDRMLMYPQDVNFTPEFPRSAELMRQFWFETFGDMPDAVVSVDPVALGYMLQGMAPVEIGGVTVTADNLARVMLNESYLTFPDPEASDAFFALASQQLFGVLVGGGTSSVAGVERAIEEGRFLVWSGDEQEQSLLQTTPIAGAFLERTDTLGLFINDGSGSKIGYYIDADAHVANHMCPDGSLHGQTVTLTLTHTFSGDVADLPWYVSGGGVYVPDGEFHANLLLYPPAGEGVTKYSVDGAPGQLAPKTHDGRAMSTARITLVPGQTLVVSYELTATEHGQLAPGFAFTPGPRPQAGDVSVDISGKDC